MKNDTRKQPSEIILQSLLDNAGPVADITSNTHRPERAAVRVSSLGSLQREATGLKFQEKSEKNPDKKLADEKQCSFDQKPPGAKVLAFGERKPSDD